MWIWCKTRALSLLTTIRTPTYTGKLQARKVVEQTWESRNTAWCWLYVYTEYKHNLATHNSWEYSMVQNTEKLKNKLLQVPGRHRFTFSRLRWKRLSHIYFNLILVEHRWRKLSFLSQKVYIWSWILTIKNFKAFAFRVVNKKHSHGHFLDAEHSRMPKT